MVRPTNPKLMAQILDAVSYLGESKGSLIRDVVSVVENSSLTSRSKLNLQVERALKKAVAAGFLRHKSGRYKMQIAFNPVRQSGRPKADNSRKMSDDSEVVDASHSRKTRNQKQSRKTRKSRSRSRSGSRALKKKVVKKRVTTMKRGNRKLGNKRKYKTKNDDVEIMLKRSRTPVSESDENDDEENDEMENMGKDEKMKRVNEDIEFQDSDDNDSVERHRSRRSKHLASGRKTPSKKGDADGSRPRKSKRRSTSRKRNQERYRNNVDESDSKEVTEFQRDFDEDQDGNDDMEIDENREDVDEVEASPNYRDNE